MTIWQSNNRTAAVKSARVHRVAGFPPCSAAFVGNALRIVRLAVPARSGISLGVSASSLLWVLPKMWELIYGSIYRYQRFGHACNAGGLRLCQKTKKLHPCIWGVVWSRLCAKSALG